MKISNYNGQRKLFNGGEIVKVCGQTRITHWEPLSVSSD